MPVVLLKSAVATVGRVVAAGGVELQRLKTVGGVVVAGSVIRERTDTRGGVVGCRLC